MMATNSTVELKMDEFDALATKIKELVKDSVHKGVAMHVLEQDLLTQLMQLGHAALSAIFQSLGDGDVGPTLQHPEHKKPLIRYPELSTRAYRSIFGDFEVTRYVYGRTISQKSFAVPLDEHLGLPENSYSLLLEGWVAQLATSEPIHEAMEKLRRIFGIPIAVDSAERILERVAKNAEHFQDNLPHVEVAAEGELLVETTDNKGIVMRHKSTAEKLPVGAPNTRRGPIPDRKQMATVCGCYSIAPHVRTPQDVLEALFREPKLDEMFDEILRKRPRPIQSRYQACLSRDQEHPEDWLDGEVSAISWLTESLM